jgi:hypothetical protein
MFILFKHIVHFRSSYPISPSEATSFHCRYKINRNTIDLARLRQSEREKHGRKDGCNTRIQEEIVNEEINSELAEAPTAAPAQENVTARNTPDTVIARVSRSCEPEARQEATKQSHGITSGDEIAAPFGLAMRGAELRSSQQGKCGLQWTHNRTGAPESKNKPGNIYTGYVLRVEAFVQGVAVCFGIGDPSPNSYCYSSDNKLFFGWYFLLIISQSF